MPRDAEADAGRLDRERAFHDDVAHRTSSRSRTGRFYAVSGGHRRYHELVTTVAPGARVLEYGCGKGTLALRLAGAGASVTGIDLSPATVARAEERVPAGLRDRVRFLEMNAEALDLPDDSFDAVCGSSILHHLDIERAYAEVARVLRPSGTALFLEPLGHNPLVNLYRRRTPDLRSDDEHPLRLADLDLARRWFGIVEAEHHDLTALAAGVLRRPGSRLETGLHRLDGWLFARLRPARRWSWTVILRLGAPVASG